MNDGTTTLSWLVIRQDDNGNRYRVGRYATRAEAQRIADSLDDRGHKQLYWVERLTPGPGPGQQNGSPR
ncbi:SPOR domain-containing protein [Streptomyces sp. NPDC050085]|uniref:SPOR domain-containing protein n=1 Tax=Streptomyces sp. NPDC050085 TaxID=3365600 RepID=UPI0037B48EAF